MPELDYAVLCDHVRVEGGVAHIISAGTEVARGSSAPLGLNMGVVLAVMFKRNECGRPHRVELHFQDEDGQHLMELQVVITPAWDEGLPKGWDVRHLLGVNFGVVFPRFGLYALEVLIDDRSEKSLRLLVTQEGSGGRSPGTPDAS